MECVILEDYKIFFANSVLASICSTKSSNKTAQKMQSSNWHIKKKKEQFNFKDTGRHLAIP